MVPSGSSSWGRSGGNPAGAPLPALADAVLGPGQLLTNEAVHLRRIEILERAFGTEVLDEHAADRVDGGTCRERDRSPTQRLTHHRHYLEQAAEQARPHGYAAHAGQQGRDQAPGI